jgi:hypothetical protein
MKGTDIYNARVTTPTNSLQAVAETMQREGSKYQPHEIVGILTQFSDVVARLINEGYAVNVGSLMKIRPAIKGRFDAEDANFSEGVQRIVVKTTVGALLRDVAAKANVRRIDGKTLPLLEKVMNLTTGNEGTLSTEGYILVTGKYIKWDTKAEDEGFFITMDGAETKLDVESNGAEGVVLALPELISGTEATLTFRTAKDGPLEQVVYSTTLIVE